ncbi:MAG: ASPIC/UnbV domain-containing protein [Pirellulaceae bacterium]|nr:ASPIC/UnbV domain-containing protein [Pirellulaceae bacterium]
MSRSPHDLESARQAERSQSGYRQQLSRLDQMLENGESWSGNERNCAFLNLGTNHSSTAQVHFATVSALTGLNFLEDSRAHALVDWDQDGNVDLCTTSRTAPRLRLMRNESTNENRFIALRLIGKSCNRDAIGARVEVKMTGQRPIVKTLNAGEGFLSQSSKWLHFGLGPPPADLRTAPAIESLDVFWPGATQPQSFRDLKADFFYEIMQDVPVPKQLARRRDLSQQLVSKALELPGTSDSAQILLSSRLPLPPLSFKQFDGATQQVVQGEGEAVWLNLWASWCAPCLRELQEISSRADELRAAGVKVVALSLDDFEQPNVEPTSLADAKRCVQDLKFPFIAGAAPAETIRRLQFASQQIFGRQSQTDLPASFLITADGELAAIYRGPVSVDRFLADAATLSADPKGLMEAALPFPGVWFDGRRRSVPIGMVADLIDHQAAQEAADYVRVHQSDLSQQPGYAEVVGYLGTLLAQKGDLEQALEMYRKALEADPKAVPVLNNMAWHLATHPDPSQRDPQLAIQQAEAAAKLTNYRVASILDTLATAYEAAEQSDQARATLDRAIEIAQQREQTELVTRLKAKRSKLE